MKRTRVAIGLLFRQGRFFAQRRDLGSSHLPGLWEFPGGKLESLEAPLDGLLRELREELHWAPETVTPLPAILHAYPGLEVELHPFLCLGADSPHTPLAWGWFTARELEFLPVPEANRKMIESLKKIPWNRDSL